jgi:3',5'-nucleoside bisphosphate phosphatase
LFAGQRMRLTGLDNFARPANVAEVAAALARDNPLPGRVPDEEDEAAGMRYILTQVRGGYNPVSVAEVIAAAHAAGALAVLAHPGRQKGVYAIPAGEADIAALAEVGLDGIEVFYPSHSAEQRSAYRELARRHGLLITAGSDSHGPENEFIRIDPDDLRLVPGVPTILERIPAS